MELLFNMLWKPEFCRFSPLPPQKFEFAGNKMEWKKRKERVWGIERKKGIEKEGDRVKERKERERERERSILWAFGWWMAYDSLFSR